jgi:hypothetical protein
MKGRDYLGDEVVDGRVIVKRMQNSGRAQTGFSMATSGWLLQKQNPRFIKNREFLDQIRDYKFSRRTVLREVSLPT